MEAFFFHGPENGCQFFGQSGVALVEVGVGVVRIHYSNVLDVGMGELARMDAFLDSLSWSDKNIDSACFQHAQAASCVGEGRDLFMGNPFF